MRRFDTVFRNIQVYTTTLDFPLVLSNSSQTIDIAVPNTPLGTTVRLIPLSDASSFDDMVLQANVVTANSIRFVMINPSAGAINPDATDFGIWTGEINTDLASAIAPVGNLALSTVFENSQSFGTDTSECGIQLLSSGIYQFSAEASLTPIWQDVNFGTEWIDDGGASAGQFEAMLTALNIGSAINLQFVGWSGFLEWQPCNQTLSLEDVNADPNPSAGGFIVQLDIRQIAVPANSVTDTASMTCTNDP